MPRTSLLSLIAAALLSFSLPAQGQELPEGKGKDGNDETGFHGTSRCGLVPRL